MLRGRCSCAIPTRRTPSPAFQLPLTPLFPLLTQKQGGGALKTPRTSISLTTVPISFNSAGDSNRLENSARNCELSAVNCKLAFVTPSFTTTSIVNVGAPTIVTLLTTTRTPKNRSKDRPLQELTQEHSQEWLCRPALYAEAARDRLEARPGVKTENPGRLQRRR
jgi:hypothetical protein